MTGSPAGHGRPKISLAAARCLARGLDALEEHTDAPLRLRDHVSGPDCEVFELQEEFELGPPGRRFLVSVPRRGRPPAERPRESAAGGSRRLG
jgi:hypothetical protein